MGCERKAEASLILAGIAATLQGESTEADLRDHIGRLRAWQASYGPDIGEAALLMVDAAIEQLVIAATAAAALEEG